MDQCDAIENGYSTRDESSHLQLVPDCPDRLCPVAAAVSRGALPQPEVIRVVLLKLARTCYIDY